MLCMKGPEKFCSFVLFLKPLCENPLESFPKYLCLSLVPREGLRSIVDWTRVVQLADTVGGEVPQHRASLMWGVPDPPTPSISCCCPQQEHPN